ncbi:diguanylate cyclase [Pseudomonas alcaligenes]|uniref:diguanylate cyclase n=4 Tax=Aquipseudomonas alcaligenes TaxID=43263 RepID=A0AA42N2A6_AQUAC|nr:diguanylate cyclase [Pseudomonas alcaligenes]MDH1056124.1 diguanylate cyclase [Pseudomonas alcaligenes]
MRYLLLMLGLLCAHAWGDVALSPEQQAYVRAHPEISMCVDPDWAPFERLNARGEHEGIAADLLRLLASRAGLTLRIHVTPDWDASLAASKAGECQLLGFLNQSPDRDAWLLFTQPYFTDANVLISREEHPSVASLGDFVGARIALPSGTSVEEKLRRLYPGLQFVIVGSEAEALRLVNERQAEFTLRSLVMAADTIKNEGWFNLKIAGQVPELDNLFRIGVLRSEPMLRDILDQAIATLTPEEVNAVVNRYVAVRVETPVDYRLLLQVVAVFVLILASNLFWVVRLRRANRKLARQAVTDALTGLANRKQLNRFSQGTVETARRHHRPLAVVLFDIDHFKVVNDQHGHLVGDQVLCDIATLLARAVRQGDCLGRWGGEEFLLICPETRGEQALQLAERILAQARNLPLATGKPCTLSAGVAQLGAGDSVNDLLQRADEALYQAKTQGRDRACLAQRSEQPELALDQRSEVVTHEG